jgi:hypothetical protein
MTRLGIPLNLRFMNYRFADEILNSNLAIKNEILGVLKRMDLPVHGTSRPELNTSIEEDLISNGWETQVPAFGVKGRGETKLDFMKGRIGVEVQFGHSSFIGIDLLKFQVASYADRNKIDAGIYIMATNAFKKEMNRRGQTWRGSLAFEKTAKYLPHFRSAIHVPILVVGLDI